MRGRGARNGQPTEPPDPTAAMEIATRFLGARPRTRWELERRLRRAAVPDATAVATLDRLAELGYLDDRAFVSWWADQRDRHAPRGRRRIEAELREHGVARDVIEEYRADDPPDRLPEDEGVPATEEERARVALAGHLRGRPLPDDVRARQRIGTFLMRRGFDTDTIRSAIGQAGDHVDVDDESESSSSGRTRRDHETHTP